MRVPVEGRTECVVDISPLGEPVIVKEPRHPDPQLQAGLPVPEGVVYTWPVIVWKLKQID